MICGNCAHAAVCEKLEEYRDPLWCQLFPSEKIECSYFDEEQTTKEDENKRLRELLTIAKTDMLYLLLELKATSETFNAEKLLPALYVLRNEHGLSVEKVNADFATICDYLGGDKDDSK